MNIIYLTRFPLLATERTLRESFKQQGNTKYSPPYLHSKYFAFQLYCLAELIHEKQTKKYTRHMHLEGTGGKCTKIPVNGEEKKMDSILTPMSCSVWIKYKFCSWTIRPPDYHSPKWPFTREVSHTNYQNSPISPVWPLTLFLTNARENPNKPMNYTNYLKKNKFVLGVC